ncbi:MAG: glycerate kinase [Eubacteriales bacterium]|nr:glycerate kinase [Eubacteriales bacterium]MDD4474883.1 glycerate kinase [Eubacteriales bacterium]
MANKKSLKIVLAFDSFKGTLTAKEACEIVAKTAEAILPDSKIVKLPVSDGGEGLCGSMASVLGGEIITVDTFDAVRRPIKSEYVILPDGKAVIEMSSASGLPLVTDLPLNALSASSFGTGIIIADALERRCKDIILGIGGSATTDGGAGMASALGIQYLDSDGNVITCGGELEKLEFIDISKMKESLKRCKITVACDVKNSLYGEKGSAYIFAPQKGASPNDVVILDRGLRRLGEIIENRTGLDVQSVQGSGAAGGLAVPLLAFTGAQLSSGADILLDILGFEESLTGCDLVITGEGSTDSQSVMGKAVGTVVSRSKAAGVPVIVLSGVLGDGYEEILSHGASAAFSTLTSLKPLSDILTNAKANLSDAAINIFKLILILY